MTDCSSNDVKTAGAKRILVVDDEEAIRKIIVSILVGAHYECREAASGVEALAMLKSGEPFDLLLTDLMMPNMDGTDLMERTKNFPDMPVIVVTAVHDISVALQTLRNGAFDYLLKPFEREQLLAVVRRALEDRRLKLYARTYVSKLEAQVAALAEQLRGRKSSRKNP